MTTLLVRLAAVLTVAIGVIVLAGWTFDLPLLKSVLPGAVEMKANTAVGLVLAGCALFIFGGQSSSPLQRLAQALALAAAALGLATLGEYLFGWQLGIDEWLFRDSGGAYTVTGGRMAPASAVAFAAIGLALAVLPRPSLRLLTWWAATVMIAIGALSFLGYLWNASELVTDRLLPPVAVNTAVAFLLLGVGTLLASQRQIIHKEHRPITFSAVEIKILAGFIGALLLLLAGGGFTYRAVAEFEDSLQSVTHTEQVRAALRHLYATIADAESTQRDYLITGIPEQLERYADLTAIVKIKEGILEGLLAGNPGQLENLAQFKRLAGQRLVLLSHGIDIYHRQGFASAKKFVAAGEGSSIMETIGALTERMDDLEESLLVDNAATVARTRHRTLVSLLLTLLVATGILTALFRGIRREMIARHKVEKSLVAAERKLLDMTDSVPGAIYQLRSYPDGSHRLEFLSKGAEELRGVDREAALRDFSVMWDTVLDEDKAVLSATMAKALQALSTTQYDFRVKGANGAFKWVRTTASLRKESDGSVLWNGYWADVTEQKRLEDTLRKRNEELSQSQKDLQQINSKLNQLTLTLEERVNQKTREVTAAVETLRESEARTRLTIDTALDPVVVMDAHGLVVDWNARAQTTFGWKREEAVGKSLDELFIPQQYRDAHSRGLKHFLATGEGPVLNRRIEITALHRDGREFPIELSITPMRINGGWTFSAFLRDITERKQVEERTRNFNKELEQRVEQRTTELTVAKAEAQQANRAKSTFLATMSHEIRTPMNGVLGMIELLALTRLDAEQRTTLGIVRESGKSLVRIIDDILDFSKIEAGRLEVRPEAASIKEVIEGVFSIYSGNASSKGLLLKPVVDPQISPAVWVDPWRLRQILNNFVSNAIKFTAKGSIEIEAQLLERVDAEDRVRFSVKDTGIGISPENQQQLFQPFSQAESDTTRRYGGTGLGLTICRRLAGLMGGSVEMVSELGKGTTMILTVSLPIADPKDLRKTEAPASRDLLSTTTRLRRLAPSVAQAEAEGTLVLLVDDHPTNRLLLVRQVKTLGYAAQSAENGVEALDKWKSGRFGMVITDCNMPEMDGYELACRIRTLESANGGKRTPIIACTANALGGEAEICFAAGMDDYLAKPVELTQLLTKLDQWLPIPEADAAEASGERSSASAPGAVTPVDRAVLAELYGGDAATERDILLDFRRVNDEDAAMLRQAVANSDIPQVTRAAHRIKGACKMVGAMGLASVCEHIEHASRANDWNTIKVYMGAFHQEWMRLDAYLDSL